MSLDKTNKTTRLFGIINPHDNPMISFMFLFGLWDIMGLNGEIWGVCIYIYVSTSSVYWDYVRDKERD
jgi:hypothetical protein